MPKRRVRKKVELVVDSGSKMDRMPLLSPERWQQKKLSLDKPQIAN
jgi:hypothetical protein